VGEKDFMFWLREFRRSKELSQDELGRLVGVTGPAVGRWESGESNPDPKQLRRLADVSGIGEIELFRLVGYLSENGDRVVTPAHPQAGGRGRDRAPGAGAGRMAGGTRARAGHRPGPGGRGASAGGDALPARYPGPVAIDTPGVAQYTTGTPARPVRPRRAYRWSARHGIM